jgi:hypothetical protein
MIPGIGWCHYVGGRRQNVDDNNISRPDRIVLQALIDICEFSSPHVLASCTYDVGMDFWGFKQAQGWPGTGFSLLPRSFNESEITFLACAFVAGGHLKPKYVAGIAEENLDELRKDPKRRRREPVT